MHTRSFPKLLALAVLLPGILILAACSAPSNPAPPPAPQRAPAGTPTAIAPSAAPTAAGQILPSVSTQPPAAQPTAAAAAASAAATVSADAATSGVLVVGTAADYEPFSFRGSDFSIDGFDPALIREVGRRLGRDVQIRDFAFDGLLGAVQLGQIDLAIAAISDTPERQNLVDLSRVYYTGAEAVLMRSDDNRAVQGDGSNIPSLKIGVQHGSVYESWLEKNYVLPGKMPANQVVPYGDIQLAVADLKGRSLDAVILDRNPALKFAQAGGVKVVEQGMAPQNFVIAMAKGSALTGQVNAAIDQLEADGTITRLARQYLALAQEDVLPPAPAAAPQAAAAKQAPAAQAPAAQAPAVVTSPTPLPPCIDGMALVQDLTYADNGMNTPATLAPGQGFTKSWRLRNSGNCAWEAAYTLMPIGGNVPAATMAGQPVAVGQAVAINGQADVSANLIAPTEFGTYQGYWQMRNTQGQLFGETVWVGVQVLPPPGPPPSPTPQPQSGATINFWADRTQVNPGERVILSWNNSGVSSVYVYRQGDCWDCNGVPGQGSKEIYPTTPQTWEMRVQRTDGGWEMRQIGINVNGPAPGSLPQIASFGIDYNKVQPGACVTLSWAVNGGFNSIRLLRNGTQLMDNAAERQYTDCVNQVDEYDYTLVVSNGASQQRAVTHLSVRN